VNVMEDEPEKESEEQAGRGLIKLAEVHSGLVPRRPEILSWPAAGARLLKEAIDSSFGLSL
jgi:hypothetical protein